MYGIVSDRIVQYRTYFTCLVEHYDNYDFHDSGMTFIDASTGPGIFVNYPRAARCLPHQLEGKIKHHHESFYHRSRKRNTSTIASPFELQAKIREAQKKRWNFH